MRGANVGYVRGLAADEREEHHIVLAEGSASKAVPDVGEVESLDEAVQGNAAGPTTSMMGRLSFVGGFSSLWAVSPGISMLQNYFASFT